MPFKRNSTKILLAVFAPTTVAVTADISTVRNSIGTFPAKASAVAVMFNPALWSSLIVGGVQYTVALGDGFQANSTLSDGHHIVQSNTGEFTSTSVVVVGVEVDSVNVAVVVPVVVPAVVVGVVLDSVKVAVVVPDVEGSVVVGVVVDSVNVAVVVTVVVASVVVMVVDAVTVVVAAVVVSGIVVVAEAVSVIVGVVVTSFVVVVSTLALRTCT